MSKYNLRAPFSGVLSEGNLQPGTMIRSGQKLGTLIQPGLYELEAAINMNNAGLIEVGDDVELRSEDIPGKWMGKVSRISEHIDQSTQTMNVYNTIESAELKEGMYLSGSVFSGGFENALRVSRGMLIGLDQVYVVEDSILKLKTVELLKLGEKEVIITGLSSGEVIMDQVFSSAYNGMKVSPTLNQSE